MRTLDEIINQKTGNAAVDSLAEKVITNTERYEKARVDNANKVVEKSTGQPRITTFPTGTVKPQIKTLTPNVGAVAATAPSYNPEAYKPTFGDISSFAHGVVDVSNRIGNSAKTTLSVLSAAANTVAPFASDYEGKAGEGFFEYYANRYNHEINQSRQGLANATYEDRANQWVEDQKPTWVKVGDEAIAAIENNPNLTEGQETIQLGKFYADNLGYGIRAGAIALGQTGGEVLLGGGLLKGLGLAAKLSQGGKVFAANALPSAVGYMEDRWQQTGNLTASDVGMGINVGTVSGALGTVLGSRQPVDIERVLTASAKNRGAQLLSAGNYGVEQSLRSLGKSSVYEGMTELGEGAVEKAGHNLQDGKPIHDGQMTNAVHNVVIGTMAGSMAATPQASWSISKELTRNTLSGTSSLAKTTYNKGKELFSSETQKNINKYSKQVDDILASTGNQETTTNDGMRQYDGILSVMGRDLDTLKEQVANEKDTKKQAKINKDIINLENSISELNSKRDAYFNGLNTEQGGTSTVDSIVDDFIHKQTQARFDLYRTAPSAPKVPKITMPDVGSGSSDSYVPTKANARTGSIHVATMGDYTKGDTGRGSGDHYDLRLARDANGKRGDINPYLDRFMVNGKPLNQYKQTGKYGEKRDGYTHEGVDYGINGAFNTDPNARKLYTNPKYQVANVTAFDNNKHGGGWVTQVTFTDGIKVNILHQNKSGAMAVAQSFKQGTGAGGRVGAVKSNYGKLGNQKSTYLNQIASALDKYNVSDEFKKVMIGQIGREGSLDASNLVNSHTDDANGQKNIGIISFQKDRATNLQNFMSQRGLYKNGKFVGSQEQLVQANVDFMMNEIMNDPKYAKTKAVMQSNDKQAIYLATSDNYIRWARTNPKFKESGERNFETFYGYANERYGSGGGSGGGTYTSNTDYDNELTQQRSLYKELQAQYDAEESAEKQAQIQAQMDEMAARIAELESAQGQNQTENTENTEQTEQAEQTRADKLADLIRYSKELNETHITKMIEAGVLTEEEATALRILDKTTQMVNANKDGGTVKKDIYLGNTKSTAEESSRGLVEYLNRFTTAISARDLSGMEKVADDLYRWEQSHTNKARAMQEAYDAYLETGKTFTVAREADTQNWRIYEGEAFTPSERKQRGAQVIKGWSKNVVQQVAREASHIQQMAHAYDALLSDNQIMPIRKLTEDMLLDFEALNTPAAQINAHTGDGITRGSNTATATNPFENVAEPVVARSTSRSDDITLSRSNTASTASSVSDHNPQVAHRHKDVADYLKAVQTMADSGENTTNNIWLGRGRTEQGRTPSISSYLYSGARKTDEGVEMINNLVDAAGNIKTGVLGMSTNIYDVNKGKKADTLNIIHDGTAEGRQSAQIEAANRFTDMIRVAVDNNPYFSDMLVSMATNPDLQLHGSNFIKGAYSEATVLREILPVIRDAVQGYNAPNKQREIVSEVLSNIGTLMSDGKYHSDVVRPLNIDDTLNGASMLQYDNSVVHGSESLSSFMAGNPVPSQTAQTASTTSMTQSDLTSIDNINNALADAATADTSVNELMIEPMNEPMIQSVTESMTEPMNELMTESVIGSVTEPVIESMPESGIESMSEPMSESVNEPMSEPVSTSVVATPRDNGIPTNKSAKAKTKIPHAMGMGANKSIVTDNPLDTEQAAEQDGDTPTLDSITDKAVPVREAMRVLNPVKPKKETTKGNTHPKAIHHAEVQSIIETLDAYNPDMQVELVSDAKAKELLDKGTPDDGVIRINKNSKDVHTELARQMMSSTINKVADELDALTDEDVADAREFDKLLKETNPDTPLTDENKQKLNRTRKLINVREDLKAASRQVAKHLRNNKEVPTELQTKVLQVINNPSDMMHYGMLDGDVKTLFKTISMPKNKGGKVGTVYQAIKSALSKYLGFNAKQETVYEKVLEAFSSSVELSVNDGAGTFIKSPVAKLTAFQDVVDVQAEHIKALRPVKDKITQTKNVLTTYFKQTQSKAKPLSSIPDFVNNLMTNPNKAAQVLGLDNPTDVQSAQLKDFGLFHTEFKEYLEDVAIKKEAGYEFRSMASYLIRDDGQIDENLLAAMSHTAYDYIIANGNHIRHSDDEIKQLLGLYDERDREAVWLTKDLRETYQHRGFVYDIQAQKLGERVAKTLNISSNELGSMELDNRLYGALGGWVLSAMQAADLVHISQMSSKKHLTNMALINLKQANKLGAMASEHGTVRFVSVTNTKGGGINPMLDDIITKNKGTAGYLADVFGGVSAQRNPLTKPPKQGDVKRSIKRTKAQVSDVQAALVDKAQQEAMVVNEGFDKLITNLMTQHEEAFMQMIGASVSADKVAKAHINDRAGMLGAADSTKRELINAINFFSGLKEDNGGRKFWDTMFMAVNSRMHLNSNVVNIQSSKLHRAWADLESYKYTVKNPSDTLSSLLDRLAEKGRHAEFKDFSQDEMYLMIFIRALGENMEGSKDFVEAYIKNDPVLGDVFEEGFTVDKLPSYVFIPAFMEYLAQDEITQGVSALGKVMKGDAITDGEMSAIAAAVGSGDMGASSLRALMEWSNFLTNKSNKEFVTSLGLGSDGINNGVMIAHVSTGVADEIMLKRTGLFTHESGYESYHDARHDKSIGDYYTAFKDKVIQDLNSTIKALNEEISNKLANDEDASELSSAVAKYENIQALFKNLKERKAAKDVLVPVNYASGEKATQLSVYRRFLSDIQSKLSGIANLAKDADDANKTIIYERDIVPLIHSLNSIMGRDINTPVVLDMLDGSNEKLTLSEDMDITLLNEAWFNSKDEQALQANFLDTVGSAIWGSLTEYEGDFLKANKRNIAILGAAADLYQSAYELRIEQVKEQKLQSLVEKYQDLGLDEKYATKLAKDEFEFIGLSHAEISQVESELDYLNPKLHTAHSIVENDEKAKVRLVTTKTQAVMGNSDLTQNNFYQMNADGMLQSTATASATKKQVIESEAQRVNSIQTQSQDARISSVAMNAVGQVHSNVHDANISGAKHHIQMAEVQNKAAYETLRDYSAQVESLTTLVDTLKQYKEFMRTNGVTPELEGVYKKSLSVAYQKMDEVFDGDTNRQNIISSLRYMQQYGAEFGKYTISDDDVILTTDIFNEQNARVSQLHSDILDMANDVSDIIQTTNQVANPVATKDAYITALGVNNNSMWGELAEEHQFMGSYLPLYNSKLSDAQKAQARQQLSKKQLDKLDKAVNDAYASKDKKAINRAVGQRNAELNIAHAVHESDVMYLINTFYEGDDGVVRQNSTARSILYKATAKGKTVYATDMYGNWGVYNPVDSTWVNVPTPHISAKPLVYSHGVKTSVSLNELLNTNTNYVPMNVNTIQEGATNSGELVSSVEQATKVLQGDTVHTIKEDSLGMPEKGGFKEVVTWASELFDSFGNVAIHPVLGSVELNTQSVRDSLAHGRMSYHKNLAFAAVKDVLEKGVIVAKDSNKSEDSFYVSAPIMLKGERVIETVLVHRDVNTQRMYLHSIQLEKNLLTPRVSEAPSKDGKRNSSSVSKGNPSEKHQGMLTSADIHNILHNILTYKGNGQQEQSKSGKSFTINDIKKAVAAREKTQAVGALFDAYMGVVEKHYPDLSLTFATGVDYMAKYHNNQITINKDVWDNPDISDNDKVRLINHELAHVVTLTGLQNKNSQAVKDLYAMYDYLKEVYDNGKWSDDARRLLDNIFTGDKDTGVAELVAYGTENKSVADFIAKNLDLRKAGVVQKNKLGILDQFYAAITSMLSMVGFKLPYRTFLSRVNEVIEEGGMDKSKLDADLFSKSVNEPDMTDTTNENGYTKAMQDEDDNSSLHSVYDSIIDNKISTEHSEHLSDLMGKIYSPMYESLMLDPTVASKYYDAKIIKAPTNTFDLSPKEAYAYSALATNIKHLLDNHNDNQAVIELKETVGQMIGHFADVVDMFPDYDNMTEIQKEQANRQYASLFLDTSKDVHERTAHIAAIMMTSEDMANRLNMRINKSTQHNSDSWFDKVMGLVYKLLNMFRDKYIHKSDTSNESVVELLTKLAKVDADVRMGKKGVVDTVYDYVYTKPMEFANTVVDKVIDTGLNAANSALNDVNTRPESVTNNTIKGAAKVHVKTFTTRLAKSRNHAKAVAGTDDIAAAPTVADLSNKAINMGIDDLVSLAHNNGKKELAALVEEVRGVHDNVSELMDKMTRYNNKANQVRNNIKENMLGTVYDWFNRELTETDQESITRTLLMTDAQALLNHHSDADVLKLVHDKKARSQRIDELIKRLEALEPKQHIHTDMIIQAKSLGYYMATETTTPNVLKSAEMIATSSGTSWAKSFDDMNQEVFDVVDELATLYALNYVKSKHNNTVTALMDKHDEALLKVLRLQQENVRLSKEEFKDNPFNYAKGYIPAIHDAHTDVVTVVADEVQSYLDEGYEMVSQEPLPQDPLDPTEPRYLLVNKNYAATRRVSGALDMYDSHHKGTEVLHYKKDGKALAEVAKQLQTQRYDTIKAGHKNYDPSKHEGNHLIPIVGNDSMIISMQAEMRGSTRDSVLKRDMNFAMLMATQNASLAVNSQIKGYQVALAKQLVAIAKDPVNGFKKRPHNYLAISSNSKDPAMQEIYRLMPYSFLKELEAGFGTGMPIVIPKKAENIIFGYKKWTVAEWFDKATGERNAFQKIITQLYHNMYGQQAKNKAAEHQRVWEWFVTQAKDIIVIRSIKVLQGNIIANMLMLALQGVPISRIVKDTMYAWREGTRYTKWQQELRKTQFELVASKDVKEAKALRAKIAKLEYQMQSSGIHAYMQEGLMSTIVEGIEMAQESKTFKSDFEKSLDKMGSKIPKTLREIGKQIIVHPDTGLHKALTKATQFSDMSAKYVLARHVEAQALKKGKPKQQAFNEGINAAQEAFLNYDVPTSRTMQMLNDLGFFNFTKFTLRFQKAMLKQLHDNTGHTLAQHYLAENLLDTAGVLNPLVPIPNVGWGIGTVVGSVGELPIAQLFFK